MKTFFYASKLSKRDNWKKEKKVILCFAYTYFYSENLSFYTYTTFWGEKAKKNQAKHRTMRLKKNSHAFIREKLKSQTVKLDMNKLLF